MTTPDDPLDYVNYTSLSFPSDAITVLALRRTHPDLFDVEDPVNFFSDHETTGAADNGMATVIYVERLLARAAFESALGGPEDVLAINGLNRDDCIDDLTELYARYGVSSGRHHTEQLVRAFEGQAAAQATGHGRSG